jgi:Rhs element Vgr protein
MSASTNIPSGSVINFSIKVAGKEIPDDIDVYAIETRCGINKIPSATITLQDGNAATGEFVISSSKTFVPGKEITIEAGYDQGTAVIFKGIITKQSITIEDDQESILDITCRDKAVKMITGRKSLTFAKKKDSEIIQSIIGNYSGLSANVSATTTQWPEQVQYYVSDWDFILARAETNAMIVTAINGKVSVFPPGKDTKSVLEIEYGNNLLEFNADLNSVNQLASVQANSWDYKTQKTINAKSNSSVAGAGNLTTKKLSGVVGLKQFQLQTAAALPKADLTNWTKAEVLKSEYSKIQGEVKFQGTATVLPGKYFTLSGLGDRFNGDHLISEVVHTIEAGSWVTEASFGLSNTWFVEEPDVMAPPAAGLLPGVQGLYNGIVKKIYEDPDSQYRILVEAPLFNAKGKGIWARLTNFYATSGAGAFFMPEVGDEVVLGFLNEDPRFPVILGSLYSSSKHKPFKELSPNKKNSKKAIVSKEAIYIEFDDENKVFTIMTPGKNQAIFSDKDKKITIKDQNNNTIEMASSGVTVKSPKSITIQAEQKLTLKGNTGISLESSGGDIALKGLNIKNTANAKFSANGSAQAEIKGGAQTTIKGAMVMIN